MTQRGSLAMAVAVLLAACGSPKEHAAPTKKAAEPPKSGLDLSDPRLAGAVRAVVKQCKPPESGLLVKCEPKLVEGVTMVEDSLGAVRALGEYCKALGGSDAVTRAVIAVRMGTQSLHRALADQPEDELYACLMRELKGTRDAFIAQQLVRPATFLATARKKEKEILEYLDGRAPPAVKRVGYECLWPNGGLRVFENLEKVLASDDVALRKAVVMGWSYVSQLRAAEQARVCTLLSSLLGDKDREVAGAAAGRLAALCPEARAQVIKLVEERLKKKQIDLAAVNALQGLLTAGGLPKAETSRVLALLTRIVTTPAGTEADLARRSALGYLAMRDSKAAAKLEKKYFPRTEPPKSTGGDSPTGTRGKKS